MGSRKVFLPTHGFLPEEAGTDRPLLADTHCHLDLAAFDEDREAVVARARQAGVGLMVNPGIDLQHSRQALALAEQYPEIYAAVGIHPNSSADFDQAVLDEIQRLAAHPKVVAIGEIGLDYYWDKVTPPIQLAAFRTQLELAADLGLPVIIHNREASDDIAKTLDAWVGHPQFLNSPLASRPFTGVLHAFGDGLPLAEQAYRWNFVLGLGGPITFTNARALHALAPQLRIDRLMLETDAPYLSPHPYRGKRNEPAHVALVCHRLAILTSLGVERIAAETTKVAHRFFGLENLPGVEATVHCSFHA